MNICANYNERSKHLTKSDRESAETSGQKLVITRIFDAPRELVFKAWTDPRHMAQWWGPKGFTNPVCEMDVRPGGAILIHMQGPDGVVTPMGGVFHEIVVPERLVFTTISREDEAGQPQLENLNTVTFAEYNGKTQLTLEVVVLKVAPAFAAALAGMEQGWNESLDRLATEVAKTPEMAHSERVQSLMGTVQSQDGTTIAFDRTGQGPALILVDGALCYRGFGPMGALSALLAPHFTVFTYDRRGRGESGDTAPFAVEREVEDIAALIAEAGGTAFVHGTSSGAALALEAARQLPGKITKVSAYEAPYSPADNPFRPPLDYLAQQTALRAEGRNGDMLALFMTIVGQPPEAIEGMRQAPVWPMLEAIAPTLVYDGAVMGDFSIPTAQLAEITTPALVMAGGASPEWMQQTAETIAASIPGAQYRTLDGQTHEVTAEAIAPVLAEFYGN